MAAHAPEQCGPPGGELPPDGACHLWMVELEHGGPHRRVASVSRLTQCRVAAHYLGIDAAKVVVDRTCEHCGHATHGRPRLGDGACLDFSVSHHGDWVWLAAVGAGRVGLDLEERRPLDDVDDLAEVALGPAELAEYRRLPRPARCEWFYRTWVRKEAVLKLTGHGLCLEPAEVDVRGPIAALPDGSRFTAPPTGPVRLRDLPAPPGYVAALATSRPLDVVRRFAADPLIRAGASHGRSRR